MKNKTIRFPLSETEKQYMRDRLDEVLGKTNGEQVIILWDKKKLTDYYQNTDIKRLLKEIKGSAIEFSEMTNNELIINNTK